ncbi:hypothetical protein WAI453_003344 [Rhynchosporium graminicola]
MGASRKSALETQRFEDNISHLFKAFSRDLEKEANDPLHCQAAWVVQKRARRVTTTIHALFFNLTERWKDSEDSRKTRIEEMLQHQRVSASAYAQPASVGQGSGAQ